MEWAGSVGAAEATRSVWFVHGILGQGRNWRSFARRLVDRAGPDWRAVLPDLRNHGAHPPRPGPHDLAASARDLATLADETASPDVVVGHSLGGKVVLSWLAQTGLPTTSTVWILDSPPGPSGPVSEVDPGDVLAALGGTATPSPDRDAVRTHLRVQGLPEGVVSWLLTSLARSPEGTWDWVYDLDGVREMLRSYRTADLWPAVADPRVQLVRAGRGDRWSTDQAARAEDGPQGWHTLAEAGHWMHVDATEAVLDLLAPSLANLPPGPIP